MNKEKKKENINSKKKKVLSNDFLESIYVIGILFCVTVIFCAVYIFCVYKNVKNTYTNETEIIENQEKEESLNEDELSQFSDYLNKTSNIEFVSNLYNDAKEIDLKELTSNGLDISEDLEYEEIRNIIRTEYGDDKQISLSSKYIKFTKDTLNSLLKEKTGIEISDFTNNNLLYSEEKDFYYNTYKEDTDIVECISGIKKENQYIIKYRVGEGDLNIRQVTLKKQDNIYVFASNYTISR